MTTSDQTTKLNTGAQRCVTYYRTAVNSRSRKASSSHAAQRLACLNYIQRHEGWTLVGEYDDRGYSGTNLDRPALRRLLGEIDARRIDIVLVSSVDRLTRSVHDFVNIRRRLATAGTSLILVTRDFPNTLDSHVLDLLARVPRDDVQ